MFVFKNIVVGNWLSLTGAITFTTGSKSVALCANLIPWKLDCFTIELGFGDEGTLTGGPISISSIDIHGFAFSTKFNGVTFSAYTELDEHSTLLGSDNATWNYLDGSSKFGLLHPVLREEDLRCRHYRGHLLDVEWLRSRGLEAQLHPDHADPPVGEVDD